MLASPSNFLPLPDYKEVKLLIKRKGASALNDFTGDLDYLDVCVRLQSVVLDVSVRFLRGHVNNLLGSTGELVLWNLRLVDSGLGLHLKPEGSEEGLAGLLLTADKNIEMGEHAGTKTAGEGGNDEGDHSLGAAERTDVSIGEPEVGEGSSSKSLV